MDEWMDGNVRNPTGPWNLNISTQVLSKVPSQIFLSGDHHTDLRLRITGSLSYALLLTASQGSSLSRHVLLLLSSLWLPEVYSRIPVKWSAKELCRHRLAMSATYTLRTCVGASDSPPRTRWSSSVPSEVWFRCSSPMSVCVYGKYWKSEPNVSRQKQHLEKLNHRQPVVEKDLAGQRGQASSSSTTSRPRPASKEPHPGARGLAFPAPKWEYGRWGGKPGPQTQPPLLLRSSACPCHLANWSVTNYAFPWKKQTVGMSWLPRFSQESLILQTSLPQTAFSKQKTQLTTQ